MRLRLITPLVIITLLLNSALLQGAGKPEKSRTVKASFSAQMNLSGAKAAGGKSTAGKAGAAKGSGVTPVPGFAGKMSFDGELAWENPRLRIDLVEQNTGESMRIHVDFNTNDALLLYPDTLNGIKGKLGQLDQSGYIAQFKSLLQQGEQRGELPAGWSRSKAGAEKVGKVDCTKWNVKGPKGEQVTWWIGKDDKPVKVSAGHGADSMLTISFGELSYGATLAADTFKVPSDFTVIAFKEKK